jgi:hypothetical protein
MAPNPASSRPLSPSTHRPYRRDGVNFSARLEHLSHARSPGDPDVDLADWLRRSSAAGRAQMHLSEEGDLLSQMCGDVTSVRSANELHRPQVQRAAAQRTNDLTGARTASGSDQSTPGTSTYSSISLPSGSLMYRL